VWIEGGILALLSVIIIYLRVAKSGIKDLRNCRNYREVSSISAFLASCAGGFLMIFRTPMAFQNRYYWIPYLVVLLLAVSLRTSRDHPSYIQANSSHNS
jgi:O-antigen ligase